jgi:hypothetical protein
VAHALKPLCVPLRPWGLRAKASRSSALRQRSSCGPKGCAGTNAYLSTFHLVVSIDACCVFIGFVYSETWTLS